MEKKNIRQNVDRQSHRSSTGCGVSRHIENRLIGRIGKISIPEAMPSSARSEALSSSAHSETFPSSSHFRLINNIKCLSTTTFLKGSTSYRLVSTFVRPLHWGFTVRTCHRALTVIPCHWALNMINLDHLIIKMFFKDKNYWKVLSLTDKYHFHEAMSSSSHSEYMTLSAHNDQYRSLYKTLDESCHRALTVRPTIKRSQWSI